LFNLIAPFGAELIDLVLAEPRVTKGHVVCEGGYTSVYTLRLYLLTRIKDIGEP